MSRTIGVLMLVCLTLPAAGQNLTRAQEGRVAVAKCYGSCLDGGGQIAAARFVLDGLDGEWPYGDFLVAACVMLQAGAQSADACRATCLDIEAAYGYRSGHVRARFNRLYQDAIREVRASGLWKGWNNYPRAGTAAFDRACVRHFQAAASAASKMAETHAEEAPDFDPEAMQQRLREVLESEVHIDPPPLHDPDFWE